MSVKSSTPLDTKYGVFQVRYHSFVEGDCVSLTYGNGLKNLDSILVRIHSSCLFSESLNSIDCDCKLQLDNAMKLMSEERSGVIIYLYQEGRGHGLEMKTRSMGIEASNHYDTVQAFNHLGLDLDKRDYKVAIKALKEDLEVPLNLRLITNNPRKEASLKNAGFNIVELIRLKYEMNDRVKAYLHVKRDKLNHNIDYLD